MVRKLVIVGALALSACGQAPVNYSEGCAMDHGFTLTAPDENGVYDTPTRDGTCLLNLPAGYGGHIAIHELDGTTTVYGKDKG